MDAWARLTRDLWHSEQPWFRARTRAAMLLAALLFVGVLILRLSLEDPATPISMLYVFPVSLVAMGTGRRAGLAAGAVAVALIVVWVLLADVDLTPVGWASRVLPLLLVGLLIGDASDRMEQAAADRAARQLAQLRHREAVEINDTLVQGMAAAKWSLEAGRTEAALRTLEETIELAQRLVSQLIREAGAEDRSWRLEPGTEPDERREGDGS